MKICSKCKQEKDLKQFSKDVNKKDMLCSICKECTNIYGAIYRQQHREERRKYQKEYSKHRGLEIKHSYVQKWVEIARQLDADKCIECGYNKCFMAIDFHHIDPKSKTISIADLFLLKPTRERIDKFMKDIKTKQVIPLCANHHRELHFKLRTASKDT